MCLRGGSEQAVDDRQGTDGVESPPLLGDRGRDRQDAVGEVLSDRLEPGFEVAGLARIVSAQMLDTESSSPSVRTLMNSSSS